MSYLSSVVRGAIEKARQMKKVDWCATIEARDDKKRWVQVTRGQFNMAYPFKEEPAACLRGMGIEMPKGVELSTWEAGEYATFDYEGEDLDGLELFVTGYLSVGLVVGDGEGAVRVTEEEL